MWVCEYATLPGIKFASSSDQTDSIPGLTCRKLESPLPGGTLTQWFAFNKILRLIDALPF